MRLFFVASELTDLAGFDKLNSAQDGRRDNHYSWASSSVGERFPYKEEATGSNPVSPTIGSKV